jgi:hypothetical protein
VNINIVYKPKELEQAELLSAFYTEVNKPFNFFSTACREHLHQTNFHNNDILQHANSISYWYEQVSGKIGYVFFL